MFASFQVFLAQMSEYFLFTMQDVKHVLYIAVGLTILRFFIDFTLFKVSIWSCTVYVCVCIHACMHVRMKEGGREPSVYLCLRGLLPGSRMGQRPRTGALLTSAPLTPRDDD